MRLPLALMIALLGASQLFAQEKKAWTLEECINYALENNIDVRQRMQDVQRADDTRAANVANFFPNLSLNAGYNWNFGLSIDPVTNVPSRIDRQTGSVSLSSQWILFDGLQNVNQMRQGRVDYLAATYNLSALRNDISVNVASGYLQILLNREILAVAEEQYRVSSLMYDQVKAQYDAGAVAKGDLLQSESQMVSDEQRLVTAQNNVALSTLDLAQLLQLPDPSVFDIESPELDVPAGSVLARSPMDIYQTAREVQPVIAASEMNVQSAQYALDRSRGQIWPTIALQAAVSTNYSDQITDFSGSTMSTQQIGYWDNSGSQVPVFTTVVVPTGAETKAPGAQLEDNLNEYVGISMTWPIFSRLQIRNSIRRQEFAVTQAELEKERVENQLRQTIQRAHADAQASLKSYMASSKAAEAAEENLTYARIRREEGAISQYEYETARNNFLSAKSQELQSKYDYIFKVRVLEFYLTNQL